MDDENIILPNKNELQDKSRKRRYSLCEQIKAETNKDDEEENEAPENKFRLIARPTEKFRLLDFSDEVLFEIFKYLDSWTLMALMNCCSRLSSLVLDHRFWNYIDLSHEPLPLGILEDVLERSQGNTSCIKLHGPPVAQHLEREDKQFSQTLAKAFKYCCVNLSILELRGITVDFRFVRITDFPASLKRLILNDCNVRFEGEKSIFLGIDTHLTKLEELAIENSNWFEPYYMMVFSKLPELRSLSLKGCQLLSDFVPYGSMAARFGFKKLEYLDLRFTPISDSDLQCFNAVSTLKEVLLDCPESLRENSTGHPQYDAELKRMLHCYCHSRINAAEAANANSDNASNSESPSTSSTSTSLTLNPSHLTIKLQPPARQQKNANGASTSAAAAAAAAAAQQSQTSAQASTSSSSTSQQSNQEQTVREEESSLSSCSSSPSASSSSSNESLPPLLGNASRSTLNNIELPLPGGNAPPFSRFLPRPDQIILLDVNNRWRRVLMQNADGHRENGGEEAQQQPPEQQQQPGQPAENPAAQAEQPAGEQQQAEDRLHPRVRLYLHEVAQRRQMAQQEPLLRQFGVQPNNNNNNNNNNDNNGNFYVNANNVEQVLSHPLFWDMINPFARVGRGGCHHRDDDGSGEQPTERIRRFECRRSMMRHRHHRSHHHPISDRGVCCFGRPRNPVEHGIIWIRIGNRPSENRFERLSIRNYKLVTDVSLQHLVQCSPFLVYLDLSGTGVTQRGIDTFKERKPQCVVVADHLNDQSNDEATPPIAPTI